MHPEATHLKPRHHAQEGMLYGSNYFKKSGFPVSIAWI